MNVTYKNSNHLQNLLSSLKSSGASKEDILNAVNDIYSTKESNNDKDDKNNNSNSIDTFDSNVD